MWKLHCQNDKTSEFSVEKLSSTFLRSPARNFCIGLFSGISSGIFLVHLYSVSPKNPPCGFLTIFSKRLGICNQFLHIYYMFLSTLDDKFSFNYFQLWRSYSSKVILTVQVRKPNFCSQRNNDKYRPGFCHWARILRSHFLWSDYNHSRKSRMQVCWRYMCYYPCLQFPLSFGWTGSHWHMSWPQ